LAEHLLHTRPLDFPGGITLIPSSGGVFEVTWNGDLLFSKKAEGRFPAHAEIDQAMDAVAASS
jgi:selenoprotein W-related protein